MTHRTLAICGVATTLAFAAGCGPGEQSGGGFAMPPTPVEIAVVAHRTVTDRFEAVGTIQAGEAITVTAEIDGVIDSIPYNEGGFIRRGALIAKIDDAQLAAELARAEALRDQSQVAFDRIKTVVDLGAGAPQDLDDAAASLKVAEANVSLARTRLSKTVITAPFSGLIGARQVSAGTFLRAGQTITELAQIDELRVNFSVPERYLSLLQRGSEVSVSTTAYPDYHLIGTINVVEPVLDASTRSARVVARVRNPERRFRPGMSANIAAVLSERQNAITVPSEAVFIDGAQPYVYVVAEDSTVLRSALTLGTRLPDVVEVVEGLSVGDRIVRAGHQKLYDGAKVATPSNEPAADAG
ncbi:MAG: efflux RND transporter periplasmic adaptor subunit [Rhodothermales bacterium]|nr:efflux RND transporter periplasmic adaptor subunit [Rhodothermales bacterium]